MKNIRYTLRPMCGLRYKKKIYKQFIFLTIKAEHFSNFKLWKHKNSYLYFVSISALRELRRRGSLDRFDRDRSRSLGGINPRYRVGPDQDYVHYNDHNHRAQGPSGRGSSRQPASEARQVGRRGGLAQDQGRSRERIRGGHGGRGVPPQGRTWVGGYSGGRGRGNLGYPGTRGNSNGRGDRGQATQQVWE